MRKPHQCRPGYGKIKIETKMKKTYRELLLEHFPEAQIATGYDQEDREATCLISFTNKSGYKVCVIDDGEGISDVEADAINMAIESAAQRALEREKLL